MLALVTGACMIPSDSYAGATPWTEQVVSADDGLPDDRLGTALAVSGDTAAIAAGTWSYNRIKAGEHQSPNDNQRGYVYIFTRQGGLWTETQKLLASDSAEYSNFGSAIALDGSNLLVAALNANVGSVSQQGAVYAFTRSGDTWVETQKFSSSDGESIDAFGSAIALHGTTAIVGALDAHPNNNTMQGKAYVFELTDGVWVEQQILTAADGAANDRFGQSVAFDGRTIMVGAPTLPYNFLHGGAVYAFEQSGETWTQIAKIIPDDSMVSDQFGFSIGLSGDAALMGAIGNSFARGAVYAFSRVDAAWVQTRKLSPADSASADQFGNALALQDETAIIGAQGMVAGDRKGTAYLLEQSNGSWGDPIELTESDAGSLDLFGSAVAYDGMTALVGAPGTTISEQDSQGDVHFFARALADVIFCDGFETAGNCGATSDR